MQVELILWPACTESWTPMLARHMPSSLKTSENPCVHHWPHHSYSPWCGLNLKCISECCSAFGNLPESLWSTGTRNLYMLQRKESGKNIATSCLKASPAYALPCLCKQALWCVLKTGKGAQEKRWKPNSVIALRTPEEFKNIEGILVHCSGGTCERA